MLPAKPDWIVCLMFPWLDLVPLAAYLLTGVGVRSWRRHGEGEPWGWREAWLIAAVLLAVWVAAGTEILSAFGALRFWPVLLWWGVPIVAWTGFLAERGRRLQQGPRGDSSSRRRGRLDTVSEGHRSQLSWRGWLYVAMAGLILAYAGLSAFFSPPNNADSLLYHMPRIVFWMQQHSLADFPTNDLSQLIMPPFTEFVGLQLMILAHGRDGAVNFVDFTTLVLLALAVSSLAEDFGADADSQAFAGLMVVAMPAAFCQSSTLVPEIVEALWTVLAAGWLWRVAVTRRCGPGRILLIAAATGLMALTHGTGYVFGLPLAILAAVAFWRSHRWKMPLVIAVFGVVLVALNFGYFRRNVMAFGNPLGLSPWRQAPFTAFGLHGPTRSRHWGSEDTFVDQQLLNRHIGPRTILENMLRDAAVMFAGPSDSANRAVNAVINGLAYLGGLNLQDPRTMATMTDGVPPSYSGAVYSPGNEYSVGWPLQMFLFLLIPLGLFLSRGEKCQTGQHLAPLALSSRPLRRLAVGRCLLFLLLPLGGWIVSAAVLRWQPIMDHLLLALPALTIPVAAAALGRDLRKFQPIFAVGLLGWLLPTMLLFPRTLVGSQAVEFRSRINLLTREQGQQARSIAAVRAALAVLHPRLIGLYSSSLPPAYSLMAPLLDGLQPQPRFTYFNAATQIHGVKEPDPNVVIGTMGGAPLIIHRDTGRRYRLVRNCGQFAIYQPVSGRRPFAGPRHGDKRPS